MESLIYLNLIILSSATSIDANSPALVYSLIGIVFATMCGIILYHFYINYVSKLLNMKGKLTEAVRKLQERFSSKQESEELVTEAVVDIRESILN